jgi:aryl-alcohol dehydrogenase-like predicted oxidoreductase
LKNINNKNTFIIGTAQLGQKYGIANTSNLNSKYLTQKFIEEAYTLNFNSFDTAASYGNSESLIGNGIKNLNKKINIYTKIPKLKNKNILEAKEKFGQSLKKLKLSNIEGLLIHNPSDWQTKGMKEFSIHLRESKIINKFGLSIYEKKQIPNDQLINLIQVPGNIFNQDLISSKELTSFNNQGGTVIIRSIFVQGLLFLKDEKFPENLLPLLEPINKFKDLANISNVSIESLAIKTVQSICPYGKLVLGCDNVKQLRALSNATNENISNNILQKAINLGKKYSSKLWDPRNW